MNRARAAVLATSSAAALAAGAAVAIPALAAAPAAQTHTLRFTSGSFAQAAFGTKGAGGVVDRDTTGTGKAKKTVAFDIIDFSASGTTAYFVVALDGGMLWGTAGNPKGNVVTGRVTGGDGAYAGATGTIRSTTANVGPVTIRYRLPG